MGQKIKKINKEEKMRKILTLGLGLVLFLGLVVTPQVTNAEYNTGYDRFRGQMSDTLWRIATQYNALSSIIFMDAAGAVTGRLTYDGQRLSWIAYSSDMPFTGESYDYNKDRTDQSKGWYHSMDFFKDGMTITATVSYRLGENGETYVDSISYADYTGSTYTVSIKGDYQASKITEGMLTTILAMVTSGNPKAEIPMGDGKTVTAELTGVYFSGADLLELGKEGILAKINKLGVSWGVVKSQEAAVVRWMFSQWDNLDNFKTAMSGLAGTAGWDNVKWQNFFDEFKNAIDELIADPTKTTFTFDGTTFVIRFDSGAVKIKKQGTTAEKTYTTFVTWMRYCLGDKIAEFYTWTAADWAAIETAIEGLIRGGADSGDITLHNGAKVKFKITGETESAAYLEIYTTDSTGTGSWKKISDTAMTVGEIKAKTAEQLKTFLKDNGFGPDWTSAMWQQLYAALFGRADKWNSNEEFDVNITNDKGVTVASFKFKFTDYNSTTGAFKINVKKPNGTWAEVGQVTDSAYQEGKGYLITGPGEDDRVPLDQVTAADLRNAQLYAVSDMIKLAFESYVTAAGDATVVSVKDGTTEPPTNVNILEDLNSFKAGIKSSPWYTRGSVAFKAAIDALTDAQWEQLYDKVMLFYDDDPNNNPTMGANNGNPNDAGWAGTIFTIGGLNITFENEGTTADGKQRICIWMKATADTGARPWYATRHIGGGDRPTPNPLVGISFDLYSKVVTSYTVLGRLQQITVNLMDPHEIGRTEQSNPWDNILWGDPAVSGTLSRSGNNWQMQVGLWSNAEGVHVDSYWYNYVATAEQKAAVDAARQALGDKFHIYNEGGSKIALNVILAGFNFTGYEGRFVTAWGIGNETGDALNRIIEIVGLGRGDYEWHPFDL